jgi:hypothetical protein
VPTRARQVAGFGEPPNLHACAQTPVFYDERHIRRLLQIVLQALTPKLRSVLGEHEIEFGNGVNLLA